MRGGPLPTSECCLRFKAVGVFVQPLQDRLQREGFATRSLSLANFEVGFDFRKGELRRGGHGVNIALTGSDVQSAAGMRARCPSWNNQMSGMSRTTEMLR